MADGGPLGSGRLADQFNLGFALDGRRKDFGFCLARAEKVGAKLPVTKIVDGFYAEVQKRGGGRFATSSLMYLLRHG